MNFALRYSFCLTSVLMVLAMLNLGLVRKKDDPILKTQTDPIALKDKMEEIKDGEKEAPSPPMKLYPKSKFLTEPPMEAQKKQEEERPKSSPEEEEPVFEEIEGLSEEEALSSEDGWEEVPEEGREEEDKVDFKEEAGLDEDSLGIKY